MAAMSKNNPARPLNTHALLAAEESVSLPGEAGEHPCGVRELRMNKPIGGCAEPVAHALLAAEESVSHPGEAGEHHSCGVRVLPGNLRNVLPGNIDNELPCNPRHFPVQHHECAPPAT